MALFRKSRVGKLLRRVKSRWYATKRDAYWLVRPASKTRLVVWIVGCQRSGTTLLGRIFEPDVRITVLHELWHISPDFNGDIRRHAGRYHAHTHSQAEYDEEMGRLADRWLQTAPPEPLYAFLRCSFQQLSARHGGIVGLKIPRPRLIPVS